MKRTKTKLVSSIVTLLVCFAMLVGSTFAWFTDSASTGVNKIQAGNLDVEFYREEVNPVNKIGTDTKLFQVDKWEPGVVSVEKLIVRNEGNLALKFKMGISNLVGGIDYNYVIEEGQTTPTDKSLLDVLYVYTSPSNIDATTARSLSGSNGILLKDFISNNNFLSGELGNNGDSKEINVAIYWPQSSIDNEYNINNGRTVSSLQSGAQNSLVVNFPVTLAATQLTSEADSFDDQYDASATYPFVLPESTVTIVETPSGNFYSGYDNTSTPIAKDSSKELKETVKVTPTSSNSVVLDVKYEYGNVTNGYEEVHSFGEVRQKVYPLTKGLSSVTVAHPAVSLTKFNTMQEYSNASDAAYYYDSATGLLYIKSSKYSKFTVTYTHSFVAVVDGEGFNTLDDAKIAANENKKIVLVNNVILDQTFVIDKGLTLDLNGYSIVGKNNRPLQFTKGTSYITGNGLIKVDKDSQNPIVSGSSVIRVGDGTNGAKSEIQVNVELYIGKGVKVTTDACYGVTIFGSNTSEKLYVDGTIVSYSGAVSGNGSPQYWGTEVVIGENAVLTATDGPGVYHPQSGKLTINGGTITGQTGVEVKGGDVVVNGGTFTSNYSGESIVDNQPDKDGGNSLGYALSVVEKKGYVGDATVTVNGGIFNSQIVKDVSPNNQNEGKENTLNIYGGTFVYNPSAYVPTGYEVNENEGKYFVTFSCGAKPVEVPESTELINTQEELNTKLAATAAEDMNTLYLGEGNFTIDNNIDCDNKTIVFIGSGYDKTILEYGSTPGNQGAEGGSCYSFENANVTFKNVTLQDVNGDNVNYEGFVRSKKLTFENCLLKSLLTYLGENGVVTFKNCTFKTPEYAAWIYVSQTYNFSNCLFKSSTGKFLNVYGDANITPIINATQCRFEGTSNGTDIKAVFNIKSNAKTKLTIKDCVVTGASPMYKVHSDNGTVVTIDGNTVYGTNAN